MNWWIGELVSRLSAGLVCCWVSKVVSRWFGAFVDWWVGGLMDWLLKDLLRWWVGALMGWWVGELFGWGFLMGLRVGWVLVVFGGLVGRVD